jgi:hypothetical protein
MSRRYNRYVPLPTVMAVPFLMGANFTVNMCVGSVRLAQDEQCARGGAAAFWCRPSLPVSSAETGYGPSCPLLSCQGETSDLHEVLATKLVRWERRRVENVVLRTAAHSLS